MFQLSSRISTLCAVVVSALLGGCHGVGGANPIDASGNSRFAVASRLECRGLQPGAQPASYVVLHSPLAHFACQPTTMPCRPGMPLPSIDAHTGPAHLPATATMLSRRHARRRPHLRAALRKTESCHHGRR